MTTLEQLASAIHHARTNGLAPTETTMRQWDELAQAATKEVHGCWLSESAFRGRTGSSDKWCVRNFARCRDVGLARVSTETRCGREWHIHARLPRQNAPEETEPMVNAIANGMAQRASA